MYRIKKSCGEIQTEEGFVFNLPSDLLKKIDNGVCEQSWYSEEGRLLADPSDPQTLMYPVTNVSSDRLVTSDCVNLIHEIICDVNGTYFSRQTTFRASSFEKKTTTISRSCGEIQTSGGYEYRVPSYLWNQTYESDCEQKWYLETRRLLADPSDPQTLMYPVTSVSSDRLVTSDCVNLNHKIICDASRWRMETVFRVRNETAATPNSVFNDTDSSGGSTQTPDSHQFWWISVLFIPAALLFICLKLRKRIFRTRRGNQTERKKVLKDPEAGVQMKLGSDSLSQSESE